MELTIINLLKQVPLPSEMRMGDDGLMDRTKAKSIINIDCQFALEAGLQLKKKYPKARLLVCSMGPTSFKNSLQKALSLGYDEAYLLSDRKLGGSDTFATGLALATLLQHLGFTKENPNPFIVLAGRQTSDGDTAHVPSQVAANLGIAQATFVEKIHFDNDNQLIVKRIIEGGYQQMQLPLPCVISLTPTGIPLRKPSLAATINARKKNIHVLNTDDINLSTEYMGVKGSPTIVAKVKDMLSERPSIQMMQGKNTKEKIDNLIAALSKQTQHKRLENVEIQEKEKHSDFPIKDIRGGYKGILTWAEVVEGKISRSSIELLGVARQLALQLDKDTTITTLLIGNKVKHLSEDLIAYGSDKVVVVEDERLKEYQILPFTSVFKQWIQGNKPEIVLFAATTSGRELAPRITVYTKSGITADCTALEIGNYVNKKEEVVIYPILHSHRPTYGESKLATILGFKFPQFSTARPGTFEIPPKDNKRQGKVVDFEPIWDKEDFCVRLLQTFRDDSSLQNLFDAEVIVAGGRGVVDDNLQLIKELVKLLQQKGIKSEWAATRVVVDSGMAEYARQVGQTGKTVRPKLYIAVGISGAIQHIAGMKEAGKIIAIDQNPKAPIFHYADFGIVGTYRDTIPELMEQIDKFISVI